MNSPKLVLWLAVCLIPLAAWAQDTPKAAPPPPGEAPDTVAVQGPQADVVPPPPKAVVKIRTGGRMGGGAGPVKYEPLVGGEFGPSGAWWKNSEIVAKLQLSDEQVAKISKTFLDHKLRLIDLQAGLDKQELRLQPLLDVDQPEETLVSAQIDLITAARGRLEKENAMMMLDIRRWLSVEQWKKLKSLEAAEPGPRGIYFFKSGKMQDGPVLNQVPFPAALPDDTPVVVPRSSPQ